MSALTHARLTEVLFYCPETGIFRHIDRPVRRSYGDVQINLRFSGKIAGTINKHGYRIISLDNRKYKAHRLAWFYVHGRWPVDQIDHINRCPGDNRLVNLREASPSLNSLNRVSRWEKARLALTAGA